MLDEKDQTNLFLTYNLKKDTMRLNSELLKEVLLLDNGSYFNILVAKETLSLMIPYATEQVKKLEEMSKAEDTPTETPSEASKKDKTCQKYVIAKKYIDIDELTDDNNKDVYFDKQYDKTYYELIDEYKKYMTDDMTTEDKIKKVAELLRENVGMTQLDAIMEAEALVEKRRLVREGDYCVLVLHDDDVKYIYYKRVNNIWERDNTVDPKIFGDETKLFCNLNDNCLQVKNNCESLADSERIIKNRNLIQIVKEFDLNMQEGLESIKQSIEEKLSYYEYRLSKLIDIKEERLYKYNAQKLQLAASVDDIDTKVSPYTSVRDTILGLSDFSQKQNFIVLFTNKFTRSASDTENKWWRYCIETNVPLLPTFIYELALAYTEGKDYIKEIYSICKKQGKYSDDGGAWVDEHSGYFITAIEFDTDEGYEEGGFKHISRDILEKDSAAFAKHEEKQKDIEKYTNPSMKKINNVIILLSDKMSIDMTEHIPKIIQETMLRLKESQLDKKALEKEKKGSYKKTFHSLLLTYAVSYFIIFIQTSIPSFKIGKGFPGCIQSLKGFPLDGEEDLSLITYMSCIIKNISKKSIDPWSGMVGKTIEEIVIMIKDNLYNIIAIDPTMVDNIKRKQKYLLMKDNEDIPEEHDIKNWETFMPPLKNNKLKLTENVSPSFKSELISDLKKGKTAQYEKLLVLQSKKNLLLSSYYFKY